MRNNKTVLFRWILSMFHFQGAGAFYLPIQSSAILYTQYHVFTGRISEEKSAGIPIVLRHSNFYLPHFVYARCVNSPMKRFKSEFLHWNPRKTNKDRTYSFNFLAYKRIYLRVKLKVTWNSRNGSSWKFFATQPHIFIASNETKRREKMFKGEKK